MVKISIDNSDSNVMEFSLSRKVKTNLRLSYIHIARAESMIVNHKPNA